MTEKDKYVYKKNPYQSITTETEADARQKIVMTNVNPNETKPGKHIPEYYSQLRGRIIEVPEEIYKASGIRIFGHRIKSALFSTDVALIRNSNANAILAVYPFTPQGTITEAIMRASPVPVFVGVGGGTTTGRRSINLAFQAEQAGAFGVVVNSPMENAVIQEMSRHIDVPLIATIASSNDDYLGKLTAGADILNVSAAAETPELVKKIRQEFGPDLPIIATGGPSGESITKTIEAGANVITYTPPTSAEIFAIMMEKYREDDSK